MLQYCDISIDKKNGLINLSLSSSISDQLAIRTNLVIPRDFHRPICLISSSGFPLKMKEVAAPIRNECVLKSCSLMFSMALNLHGLECRE
jgi:hypothetical protein